MQTTKDFIKDIPKIYGDGWREFKGIFQKIFYFGSLPIITLIIIILIVMHILNEIVDRTIKKFILHN